MDSTNKDLLFNKTFSKLILNNPVSFPFLPTCIDETNYIQASLSYDKFKINKLECNRKSRRLQAKKDKKKN